MKSKLFNIYFQYLWKKIILLFEYETEQKNKSLKKALLKWKTVSNRETVLFLFVISSEQLTAIQ